MLILFVLTDCHIIFRGNLYASILKRSKRHTQLSSSQLCQAFGCVNGECVASEMRNFRIVCSCFTGYEGKLCDRLACPYDCGKHGTCVKEEEMMYCQCDQGYYGVNCNSTELSSHIDPDTSHRKLTLESNIMPLNSFVNIPKSVRPKTKVFNSKTRKRWFSHKFIPHWKDFHSHAEIDKSVAPDICAPGFKCYHGRCDRESMSYGIFKCLCQENYSGLFCEKKCTLKCKNDGYCTVLDDGHQYCICPFDFTGHYCEKRAKKRYNNTF